MSINQVIESSFRESGVNISEGLANAVAENLITKDYAALEVNLRYALSNSNLLSAAITDKTGKAIINLKRAGIGMRPNLDFGSKFATLEDGAVKPFNESEAIGLVSWYPIIRGIHIGWVRVEASKIDSQKILSTLSLNALIILFLSLSLIVLFSIWKLRNYFSNISTWNKKVNSTTKCNFDKCLVAKDVLVSKASRPASQSSHDLSTP